MDESFSSDTLPEARSRTIKPLFCCKTRHETFFKYYTTWLIVSELLTLVYYWLLYMADQFGYHHLSLLASLINLSILFKMVQQYRKHYDYGMSLHYYFSAILYYFSLVVYVCFFAAILVITVIKIEYVLNHPLIGGNRGMMFTIMIIMFFIILPHATFDLYLKYLYHQVIKVKKEENRVKGEAELILSTQPEDDRAEEKTQDSGLI